MDSNKMFLIGLAILGLFVITDSIWVILTPAYGDKPQRYILVVTGIFLIFIVYILARHNRKSIQIT